MSCSGPTLEEVARIFDGDNAEVADVDIKGAGLTNRTNSATSFDEERMPQNEKSETVVYSEKQ